MKHKTERKTKFTIAVISGRDTFFYNGYFQKPDTTLDAYSDAFLKHNMFLFFDEKESREYWINWDKVIWIKEIKRN